MSKQAEKDDAYRAIGRWFVEFSRLLFHMRLGVEQRLARGEDPAIARIALGHVTADQLTTIFFEFCERVGELDEQEKKIIVCLKKSARVAIRHRNDFAHGDWWVGFGMKADGKGVIPFFGG